MVVQYLWALGKNQGAYGDLHAMGFGLGARAMCDFNRGLHRLPLLLAVAGADSGEALVQGF